MSRQFLLTEIFSPRILVSLFPFPLSTLVNEALLKSFLRYSTFPLILCGILSTAALFTSASAQNITKAAAKSLSDWHAVQALPAQTRIRIIAGKKKTACFVDSVADDHLTCSSSSSKSSTQAEYAKEEIKEIKLTNKSRSTLGGAALIGGASAGAGALIAVAINGSNNSQFNICCRNSEAAAVGAGVAGAAGAITGAALGYAKDWFASPVIYRRP